MASVEAPTSAVAAKLPKGVTALPDGWVRELNAAGDARYLHKPTCVASFTLVLDDAALAARRKSGGSKKRAERADGAGDDGGNEDPNGDASEDAEQKIVKTITKRLRGMSAATKRRLVEAIQKDLDEEVDDTVD
jgi:hypothetical protein